MCIILSTFFSLQRITQVINCNILSVTQVRQTLTCLTFKPNSLSIFDFSDKETCSNSNNDVHDNVVVL